MQHCKEKINTAYSYLGIIKRNFIYLDEYAFVMLYKSLVRSHLEYANSVWNSHRLGLIEDLEQVQRHATKSVNFREASEFGQPLRGAELLVRPTC